MNIFLVTGTGTGVGKTFVTVGICRMLSRRGIPFSVFKPFETGIAEGLSDAETIRTSLALDVSVETISPVRLGHPLAPLAAARLDGVTIDHAAVIDHIRRHASGSEVVIVEGAGGIAVPIEDGYDFRDLARDLGARTVIVAANRLGVVNHTLLTCAYLVDRGLPIASVALNDLTPTLDESSSGNRALVGELLGGEIPLIRIPHGADAASSDIHYGALIGR